MNLKDLMRGFKDFWDEFRRVPLGIVGLCLLLLFILLTLFESSIIPYADTNTRWRDIRYWEDNSRSVPPIWIDIFSSKKHAKNKHLSSFEKRVQKNDSIPSKLFEFTYDYTYDIAPLDIIVNGVFSGSPLLSIKLVRPDSHTIDLVTKSVDQGISKNIRISLENDAKKKVQAFAKRIDRSASTADLDMVSTSQLIFSKAEKGIFSSPQPLRGRYSFQVECFFQDSKDTVHSIAAFVSGSASGLLGTDNSKRDLWSGIIAGVKWALLIGILTALVSVSIGVTYGVVCAYFGSWKDSLLQRIFEVFISIPLLPLLIVMSAIFQPSIAVLIIMMSCFFWVNPVKTVRSIGLQIKEEMYIEASRSYGASGWRIVFKHMVPLLVPYAFALMALIVPQAIVYESTVSLLGLGDSTIVTWGQILHDAFVGGAVINGQWWWIIPPGIAIALMGMTFAFIGFAMDKILHPKLRTR